MRRGFIKGFNLEQPLVDFVQAEPKFIYEKDLDRMDKLADFKKRHFKIVPIVDDTHSIVDLFNLDYKQL